MNFFTSKNAAVCLSILFALVLLWDVILHSMSSHETVWHYLYSAGYALLYLFGAFASLFAYRTLGKEGLVARGFLYLSISFTFYALGLICWSYYAVFEGNAVPYPSLADAFYVVFIVFTVIAINAFLKIYQILVTRRVVIESVAVFLLTLIATFVYQFSTAFAGDISWAEKAVNVLYLVTDSLFIAIAVIVIRSSGGKIRASLILLALGYLAQTFGDLLFDYWDAQGTYWNGDFSDVLLALSAYLLALAAVYLTRELIGTKNIAAAGTELTA